MNIFKKIERKMRRSVIKHFMFCADSEMRGSFKSELDSKIRRIESIFKDNLDTVINRYEAIFKDVPYLISEGFVFDFQKEVFVGRVIAKPGKEYEITIELPENYPNDAPFIFAKPLFEGSMPPHAESGPRNSVCIDGYGSGDHGQSYWSKEVNLKSTLHLAMLVLKGEIDKVRSQKHKKEVREISVIDRIREKGDKRQFIDFLKNQGMDVNYGSSWNVIDRVCAQSSLEFKKLLIQYERGLNGRKKK